LCNGHLGRADLELAAACDDDLDPGLATVRALSLNLLNHVHAFNDLSEDDVLAVEPGRLGGADEELGSVGVGSTVGHRQNPGLGVLQAEVFVSEGLAVDGLAAAPVPLWLVKSPSSTSTEGSPLGSCLLCC